MDLLAHALRQGGARYTFESHGSSQGVAHATARQDLLNLVNKNLMEKRKSGSEFFFVPVQNLREKLHGSE